MFLRDTNKMRDAWLGPIFGAIALAFRLLLSPGDEVLIPAPDYPLWTAAVSLSGGKPVHYLCDEQAGWFPDVDDIRRKISPRTKAIVVINPNNPTGNLFSLDEIERVVEAVDCPVAIDEAYAEFSGIDHLDLARKYPNVIILRTLSKFAGLAGIRVGYAIFPEDMAPYVAAAVPAFANISALSAEIAIACLQDLDYLSANRDEQVSERERVTALLNEIPGVTAYPSATNFVMFDVPGDDATPVLDALKERHIYVRHYGNPEWGLGGHLRVSIGLPEENTAFLTALEEIITGKEGT